jgi:hypothetical protein
MILRCTEAIALHYFIMPNIFEVIDPRGFTVGCTINTWYDHILAGRPWMAGWEQDVANTIVDPLMICQDKNHGDRNIYYQIRNKGTRYLRVVVVINENCYGMVMTAFPSDGGKVGEVWIWPASND